MNPAAAAPNQTRTESWLTLSDEPLGALPTPGRFVGVGVGFGPESGLLEHATSKIEARGIAAKIFVRWREERGSSELGLIGHLRSGCRHFGGPSGDARQAVESVLIEVPCRKSEARVDMGENAIHCTRVFLSGWLPS